MAGLLGNPNQGEGILASLLGEARNPPPPPALSPSALFGALFGTPPRPGFADGIFETIRRRSAWNDRLAHWQKAATGTEEATIERARRNVLAVTADNRWLLDSSVVVASQGSYHNNTNVRTEADIDLRAVHRALKIEYAPGVVPQSAAGALGYSNYGMTFEQIFGRMRSELTGDLSRRFGASNVVSGKKAIRIKGISGSRAEVDVVPTIGFHYVSWDASSSRFNIDEGVAILSTDSAWTVNFPVQHTANGVAKRARTRHRFKKVVRVLKRMRADMTARRVLTVSVPSFLVECLAYLVEDWHFLVDGDDRYARVRRVAMRIQELLSNPQAEASLCEINELKLLFHPAQAWSHSGAVTFADAVVAHLGDA